MVSSRLRAQLSSQQDAAPGNQISYTIGYRIYYTIGSYLLHDGVVFASKLGRTSNHKYLCGKFRCANFKKNVVSSRLRAQLSSQQDAAPGNEIYYTKFTARNLLQKTLHSIYYTTQATNFIFV